MLVSTRWVVLPIQPLAGSVHQGGNGLFTLNLLHLSCADVKASVFQWPKEFLAHHESLGFVPLPGSDEEEEEIDDAA